MFRYRNDCPYFNAIKAKDKLQNEYKDRKIIVIDSLCSSSGYGMLVDDAKDMFDEGVDYKEIIKWLDDPKHTKTPKIYNDFVHDGYLY